MVIDDVFICFLAGLLDIFYMFDITRLCLLFIRLSIWLSTVETRPDSPEYAQ